MIARLTVDLQYQQFCTLYYGFNNILSVNKF